MASASFSLRNIIAKDYPKDILNINININIYKSKLDTDMFKLFFPTLKNLNNNDIKIFMYIYELRNNTFHFKKINEFKENTVKELFEFGKNDRKNNESLYCDEILKSYIT